MDSLSFKTASSTINAEKETSSPSTPRETVDVRKSPKKIRKYPSFIRKISNEWSHFLVKIRQITDLNLTDEEFIDSLFDSSDDELFSMHAKNRANTNLTRAESQFLLNYEKYHSLDKIADQHRNMSGFSETPVMSPIGDKSAFSSCTTNSKDGHTLSKLSSTQHTDSNGDVENTTDPKNNPGEALWEERRKQWLTPSSDVDTEEKRNARIAQSTIRHISKTMYPRLYKDFMEKSKSLKKGKAINLEDFIAIINAGWTAEKKWERAAQGLP